MADTDTQPFAIRQCLGSGGFGEVYLAEVQHGEASAEVALKVLHRGLDPRSQGVQRLKDEARLLMMIDHPNILRTFDLVQVDGRVALVSEYVEGLDLEDLLEPLKIPLPAGLEVLAGIADGLHAAYHTRGPRGTPLKLLHRDVKPGNIRISRSGSVKLLDFGIAKATGVTREAKTKTASVLGSFGYMAPERFDPQEEDTPAGDVCSLGCVMYELVNGQMLLENYDVRDMFRLALVEEKRAKVLEQRFADLGNVPDAMLDLLRDLLAYEAKDRPSLPEAARRLRALALHLPGERLAAWCASYPWPAPPSGDGALSGQTLMAHAMELVALDEPAEPVIRAAPVSLGFDGTLAVHGTPVSGPTFTPPEEDAILTAGAEVEPPVPAKTSALVAPIGTDTDGIDGSLLGGFDSDDDDDDEYPVRRRGGWFFGMAAVALLLGLGVAALAMVAVVPMMAGGDQGAENPGPSDGLLAPPRPQPAKKEPVRLDPLPEPKKNAAPDVVEPEPDAVEPEPDAVEPEKDPDAVVDAANLEPAAAVADLDRCGSLLEFEPAALLGRIDPESNRCLDGLMRDTSLKLTDRRKVGRVRLNDALSRCRNSEGCEAYEASQIYFFSELDRSDPEMMLTYAAHMKRNAGGSVRRLGAARLWADRALEQRSRWGKDVHVSKVKKAFQIRAEASTALWKLDSEDTSKQSLARDDAAEWATYVIQVNGDPKVPLALCESAAGSREVCDSRVATEAVKEPIRFGSRPAEAEVLIDGKTVCESTPCAVPLVFGTHTVVMRLGDHESSKTIQVGGGSPRNWFWTKTPAEGVPEWHSP